MLPGDVAHTVWQVDTARARELAVPVRPIADSVADTWAWQVKANLRHPPVPGRGARADRAAQRREAGRGGGGRPGRLSGPARHGCRRAGQRRPPLGPPLPRADGRLRSRRGSRVAATPRRWRRPRRWRGSSTDAQAASGCGPGRSRRVCSRTCSGRPVGSGPNSSASPSRQSTSVVQRVAWVVNAHTLAVGEGVQQPPPGPGMHLTTSREVVVVEPGPPQPGLVELEPERLDQVQGRAGAGGNPDRVAGVPGDPGLEEDHVQHADECARPAGHAVPPCSAGSAAGTACTYPWGIRPGQSRDKGPWRGACRWRSVGVVLRRGGVQWRTTHGSLAGPVASAP